MFRKIVFWILGLFALYFGLCLFFLFFQESLIFNPKKLPPDYKFDFENEYEEVYIESKDGISLHGILCKSDSTKGLLFFLHGTGGNVTWYKESIPFYTSLDYDIFILDYRGYGKSEGKVVQEQDVYDDAISAYDYMKTRYNEDNIVIIGFSMGATPAAMIASKNHPKGLILEGGGFDMLEKGKKKLPFLPVSIIARYRFLISEHIPKIKAPIKVFHGDQDKASDINNSLRLRPLLKPGDKIIILEGEGHYDFAQNKQYVSELADILN